nr:uncharacterized protein LOC122322151 [Drosophila bipectinata]
MQRNLITRLKDIHSILVGSVPEEHARPVITPKPVCPRCERAGIDTVEKEQQTLPTEVWTQDQAVQTGSIPNSTGPKSAHRDSGAKVATANTTARPKPAVANPATDKGSDGEASRRRSEWTKAKPRNPERRRARPDAIVIQAAGMTYSQIQSMVTRREDGKLDALGPCVKRVRKTAKTQTLKGCIEEVLGSKEEVRAYSEETKESLVELRRLDALATSEDIIGAIAQQAAVDQGALKVKKLRSSYGETQTAIVAFPASLAKAIIAVGKVKVGWSVCHMREKEVVARCYRCLGMGHIASACKSSKDRSGCGFRCGDTDHRAVTCKKDP